MGRDRGRGHRGWRGRHLGKKYTRGHVCTDDARLLDQFGSIGPSQLERSVCDVADPDQLARRKRPHEPHLTGVVAWADTRERPSATRWAHMSIPALQALLFHGDW
ncbi:hypothetical protein [Agromyces allii]|uniref:hypothetical protein n=1 Tax=Agromyces allii TaxID=393607 RepID=UPI0012F8247B|nr:hypothetical protein [Agromyces allii]